MTQVKVPSGIVGRHVLEVVAASRRRRAACFFLSTLRRVGRHLDAAARRTGSAPVRLAGLAATSAGVPCAMTRPPPSPAAGPISIRWSAWRIASSSCSTTSTVLPRSRSRRSVPSRRSLSRWCRPMRGFVQHVEHAGQAGADLRGQPDALRFAARQRGRGAAEAEVVQPDIDQELQAVLDLAQDAAGDLLALRRQRLHHRGEPVARAADRQLADLARCACRRPSPTAPAASGGSRCRRRRACRPGSATGPRAPRGCRFPGSGARRFGMHALEGLLHLIGAQAVLVARA